MEEIFTGLIPYLLLGLQVTLAVTFIALSIGFVLGLGMAILRVYGGKYTSRLIAIYTLVIRALPHILMLLIVFFVIASIINLTAFWAGSLSLAVISSAYQAEIFRGALQSINPGQMMAARTLGMTRSQAILHIILPQALRVAIRAQFYSARTYQPFTAFIAVAILYFILTFLTNRGLGALERKLRIPGM